MSAIWGTVSFHTELPNQVSPDMRRPFETYKIDRFQEHTCPQAYMGCGIQYITPQSIKEPLPIYDHGRQLLFTADCYLDNRSELLRELSPEDSSVPDGMLMYLGYLKWGMDCLMHFLGVYSMALYRLDTKTLYLASDHTASRCLYYYRSRDGITFSTLLKPILALHPEIKRNSLYIKDFLCAPHMIPNIIPEDTPYEQVFKLTPATWLEFLENEEKSHIYWDPLTEPFPGFPHHAKAWGDAFLQLYDLCVSQTLQTDQNIAIALSSGLDSSSVGALAARNLQKCNKSLYAYTYVPFLAPTRHSRYQIQDETEQVKEISAMYPNILPHFLNNGGQNAFRFIPEELEAMEIPFKAFVNIPNLLEIEKKAREDGCRILLTGQCGNSTVSYGEFPSILYDAYKRYNLPAYLALINQYGRKIRISRKKLLCRSLRDFRREKKSPADSCSLTNPFLSQEILNDYPLETRFHRGKRDELDRAFYTEKQYRQNCFVPAVFSYLGEVETKSGLLHGILLRDPTRDPRILHFCCHLPYSFFCYQGTPRWLIRGNFQDMLPDSVLNHWSARGLQNADWYLRIQRDWDTISPAFYAALQEASIKNYFQWDAIEDFFRKAEMDPSSVDFIQLKCMIFLYIAALSHIKI